MKQFYLLPIVVIIIIFYGCSVAGKTDPVRLFIPGVYVRSVSNEFSAGQDTLVITQLSRLGSSYQIVHRSGYQRIVSGKPQKRETRLENWTAIYNEQDKVLHETRKGKLISFNPEQESLTVGSSEYKKVE